MHLLEPVDLTFFSVPVAPSRQQSQVLDLRERARQDEKTGDREKEAQRSNLRRKTRAI